MRRLLPAIALPVLLLASSFAGAETLRQALAYAWLHNPDLLAARATQTAAQSDIRAAKGAWYPQLALTGGIARDHESGEITFFPEPTTFDADLDQNRIALRLDQTLYQGGRIAADVSAARDEASAAHAQTRADESSVLLNVVRTYLGVVEAQAVLAVQERNIAVLHRQWEAARQSLAHGEGTRTDVAQAESRLQAGIAARIRAAANLAEMRAEYRAVVGHEPLATSLPTEAPALPASLQQAEALASENDYVAAARFTAEAAAAQADAAHGALYPSLGLYAEINRQNNPQFGFSTLTDREIGVDVSIPIWQGGSLRARSSAARARADSASFEARSASQQAEAQAASAWQDHLAAHSAIAATQAQLDAARIAFRGVEAEHRQGERTLLDVLNAEQEVRNGEVALVQTQRDNLLADYALLAATGSLSAAALHLAPPAAGSAP
ncbi:MAG TPA: TolC family outer membrane protein [Gammaproteobacteria bacterium]|nr:TolC family outer membrane protein [Gammaproteobacteria bacterium]